MDFVILYALMNYLFFIAGIALFIRYSCDCLDGAVARKYNRVSDLGGILDTVADNTMIFVLVHSISYLLGSSYSALLASLITGLNLAYLAGSKALIHHHNVKNGGNLIQNIYTFGVNNNCLLYSAVYIFILLI